MSESTAVLADGTDVSDQEKVNGIIGRVLGSLAAPARDREALAGENAALKETLGGALVQGLRDAIAKGALNDFVSEYRAELQQGV